MAFRDITYSFILIICAITRETHSIPRLKMDDETKKNNLEKNFTQLLDSLVKVNENRMEELDKFLKLNNYHTVKNTFRASGDKEQPSLAVFTVDRNGKAGKVYQIISGHFIEPLQYDSDSDSNGSSESEDLSMEKGGFLDDYNLRMRDTKYKSSSESGHVVLSSENKNQLNIKNDTLLSDSESYEESKLISNKRTARLKGSCVRSSHSYTYCVVACKAAYRHACLSHSCSHSLYSALRNECRSECSKKFEYY